MSSPHVLRSFIGLAVVDLPGAFVTGRPLEQLVDAEHSLVDVGMKVAELARSERAQSGS